MTTTPISLGLLDSWLEGWAIAVSGIADCASTSLRRGPPDVVRWTELMAMRQPPSWATPNEVVLETPLARLRDFSASAVGAPLPVLVLPPQAGHSSCIVDYAPDQSQMRTIVDRGLKRAFALEWLGATEETAEASIEEHVEVVDAAVDHCGGRVNLVGDCQGGWLATIYAALHPERVQTLTLAGAPIDFHAGEPVVHELMRTLAPGGDLRFYEALVAAGGGVLKGDCMLSGFTTIKPGDEISRQLALLQHLDDPAQVARYTEFEDWFKHTQDIPGAFYLWIVRHLFRDNELVRGALRIGGRRVQLSRIDMPLNLLGGATDHITPPDQVFALAAHASTPSALVRREVTAGGHLGLFMGHESLREHWPALLGEVLRHSRDRLRTRAASARQSRQGRPSPSGRARRGEGADA